MDSLKPRHHVPALLLLGLLLFPASSLGATTFGSRLDRNPSNSGECDVANPGDPITPCTLVSFIHPSDPDGDPYAGGAPVNGVITKFRIRAHGGGDGDVGTLAAEVTFRLADINRPDPGDPENALATAGGTGPTVTIPAVADASGDTPILEFEARLGVQQGQHLALDGTNVHATYNNSGDKYTYRFTPPLVEGQGAQGSAEATGELLVQADIEPDADGDGFGDETQDNCPTQATTQGACDTGKPGVTRVKVGARKIAYRLSEAASLTFKVERQKPGRRAGGKCRKPNAKNRANRKCKRFVKVRGTLSQNGQAGLNELVWNRRIGGRKLRAGRYRLVVTATDAAGNTNTKRTKFRIKKKPKKS